MTHKGVDLVPDPVVGLVLHVGVAEKSQDEITLLNQKSLRNISSLKQHLSQTKNPCLDTTPVEIIK